MGYSNGHLWKASQIDDLIALKKQAKSFHQIAVALNKKYNIELSSDAVGSKWRRVREQHPLETEGQEISLLRDRGRLRRNNYKKTREANLITKHLDQQDEIITRIKLACRRMSKLKLKVAKKKINKGEKFTLEPLFSDLHIGKLTRDFNREVLQRRLSHYACEILEISRTINVERIVLAALGDFIENQTMHGIHSVRNCEFSTSQQIQFMIEDFWEYVLLPLCLEGIPIDFFGVSGNHDRDTPSREYHYPGRHNFTFIIYNTLKLMAHTCGFKHVKFEIPDIAYCQVQIYGLNVVFEHFDQLKSMNPDSAVKLIQKRSDQLEKPIHHIRGGHFHTANFIDGGRIVFNGGMPGGEGYSDTKGYKSNPGQVVSVYSNKQGYLYSRFIRCE
jgi:hypothetical protein